MDLFGEPASLSWFFKGLLWIAERHLEIIATITGFIYLIYSIDGDKKLWIYGLISSSLYVFICFDAGIYADMGINIYYVLVSIYGWVHWSLFKNKTIKEIPYSRTKLSEGFIISVVTIVLFVLLVYVLKKYTNSNVPYLDSFTTALSITATWMLARKIIEHWLLWIVIDSVSVGLYYYKGLFPTSFLFLVYTVLAISGYITWRNKWKLQEKI
jgi:nicotinamide mononucleotide transporter